MEVSVENTSTLKRRMTVQLPASEIDSKVNAKLQETQKNIRLAGFRPGKVPVREVRRRFGAAIRQEIVGELVEKSYSDALAKEAINPVGPPSIENVINEDGKNLEYSAVFEVYPTVEQVSLDGLNIDRLTADIGESDIDEMIQSLREQRSSWQEKEEAAENGDQVTLSYKGSVDGDYFEGGTADESTIELGAGKMIPGFEDQLVGAVVGEERVLNVTFPEDYQAENLRGKEAQFETKIAKVEGKQLPEINEAFFEQFGVSEGGEEAFRAEVLKNMEQQKAAAEKRVFSSQVSAQIVKANPLEVPEALVSREAINQRDAALKNIFGQVPEQIKNNPQLMPMEGFKDQARQNVHSGLLMVELIKANDIKVDQVRLEERIVEVASSYEDPESIADYFRNDPNQRQQVEQDVLETQVMEFISSKVEVQEKTVAFKELMEYKVEQDDQEASETEEA